MLSPLILLNRTIKGVITHPSYKSYFTLKPITFKNGNSICHCFDIQVKDNFISQYLSAVVTKGTRNRKKKYVLQKTN